MLCSDLIEREWGIVFRSLKELIPSEGLWSVERLTQSVTSKIPLPQYESGRNVYFFSLANTHASWGRSVDFAIFICNNICRLKKAALAPRV